MQRPLRSMRPPSSRPRRHATALLASAGLLLGSTLAPPTALAVHEGPTGPSGTPAPFDIRDTTADAVPDPSQQRAVRDLLAGEPGRARVTWDPRFGTPRTIIPADGTLTDPADGEAVRIARQWVSAHRAAFGLGEQDVTELAVTQDHTLGTGSHVVNFARTEAGVRSVHGGSMAVVVREDGSVESYAGQLAPSEDLHGSWELSPAQALDRVAGELAPDTAFTPTALKEKNGFQVFERGPFAAGSYVRRAIFATADGPRAAYQVLFVQRLDAAYDVVIDAAGGKVLYRASLVDHDAEGTVYPNHPGAESGGQSVIRSFGPTPQSPSGYVDPTGIAGLEGPTTAGNNANTYANYSNFLVPADQGPRPVSPTSQFNYAYANNWGRTDGRTVPPSYASDLNPAATNLFWHHNRIHDEFARFGWTASGGNFQVNNNGKGGQGGDPILGLVHAGAVSGGEPTYTGRDNAYMLTLPDGIAPWSGMFLWEPINDAFEGPYSDGNFDASVIEHEYAHGLSNRYVSAEDNALNAHQSGSMGEGWGDWYGLNYLHREGLSDKAVVGEHVTGNGERGIRNWSFDENPTTYGDIGYDVTGPEVHADGEIWTAILWDYRQDLVERFGETRGSEIAALTITDAMPRSPADPSMLDMRNAIELAIDDRYHDSADYEQIYDAFWTTFAKRGAGLHAASEGGADTDPVPAFDHENPARNGTITGKVVNASTGEPLAGARVMLGVFEARVSPLRTTSAEGGFSAPVVDGTYPVTVQAPGFGSRTFQDVRVQAGRTTALTFSLAPNLTSTSNGAEVISSSGGNVAALTDDTEASSWRTTRRGNAVIELAKPAAINSVQVSAYTTSRFEGLSDFTLQVSDDGQVWRNAMVRKDAFSYRAPRPTAPDLRMRTFALDSPVQAKYVRFFADAPLGETKDSVQVAELQVFSDTVTGVQPLPPEPPDEPVHDSGTIATGTPLPPTAPGVTMADFTTNCTSPPGSQGTDGWVTTVPDSFGDGQHSVTVTGSSPGPYDLDLYFYDEQCREVGSAASSAADESGTLPSGTKHVLTHLWTGAGVQVELTATDTR